MTSKFDLPALASHGRRAALGLIGGDVEAPQLVPNPVFARTAMGWDRQTIRKYVRHSRSQSGAAC